MPSLFCEGRRWNSPYINHFLSPDSIIPDRTNPQSWNRYSYVNNNPVRYTDPTGHMSVAESGGTRGCSDPKYCQNGKPKPYGKIKPQSNRCDTDGNGFADIPCSGLNTRRWDDGINRSNGSDATCPVSSLVECYYRHASLDMGQQPVNIDPEEFQDLQLAIYYEIEGRNRLDLVSSSLNYDTPFFDLGDISPGGALPGTGCINSRCFARHELNYVAQGEISAAAGESYAEGLSRVFLWKLAHGKLPSSGTVEMFSNGYSYYHAQSGSTPPAYPLYLSPLGTGF